mmetsp:Transcript_27005/g.85926  ORF Transcript_27005/g.85926 Transcript_27005/m.85926 type:complete len:94 (-) Transcript_27005:485-766(-)
MGSFFGQRLPRCLHGAQSTGQQSALGASGLAQKQADADAPVQVADRVVVARQMLLLPARQNAVASFARGKSPPQLAGGLESAWLDRTYHAAPW